MKYLIKNAEHVTFALTALLLPALMIYYRNSYAGESPIEYATIYTYYAPFFAGGVLALLTALYLGWSNKTGKSFTYIGIALIFMVCGAFVWDYYAYFTEESPYPTFAEFFYFLVAPLIALGIYYLVSVYKIQIKTYMWLLTSVLVVAWIGFAVWVSGFSFADSFADGSLASFTDLGYFISDALTFGLTVLLLTLIGGRMVSGFKFFTFGFVVFGIANAWFFYRINLGTYYEGDISDILFTVAGAVMGIGIVMARRKVVALTETSQ